MKHSLRKHPGLLVPRALLLLSTPLAAAQLPAPVRAAWCQGGWEFSAYGGVASTSQSDVYFAGPGSTNLSLADVPWTDQSFEDPPYYGLRATYWLRGDPRWGFAADSARVKPIADGGATVQTDGVLMGSPVSGPTLVGDVFDTLSFARGLDLVTVNSIHRWLPTEETSRSFLRDLTPYVGAGVGVAAPHVEVITAESVTDEYQVAGPALQALAGLSWHFSDHLALFAEYKLSWADVDAQLVGGGSLATEPWTQQAALGLSWSL